MFTSPLAVAPWAVGEDSSSKRPAHLEQTAAGEDSEGTAGASGRLDLTSSLRGLVAV